MQNTLTVVDGEACDLCFSYIEFVQSTRTENGGPYPYLPCLIVYTPIEAT